MKTHSNITLCLLALTLTPIALAQTTTAANLPTAVSVVGEFNQLASPQWALGLSAMYTTTPQAGIAMFNTSSADVVPVKAVDPTTKKSFYAISAQFRQGVHERLLGTGNLMISAGADVGPGFSSTAAGGIAISATGSFVVTALYKVNSYLGLLAPIRMLYVSGIGWNPVAQFGVAINLKKLPPAK